MALLVHRTLADLYRALNLPIEQDMNFTIHFLPDIHKSLPFQSPVFRAEYFSFVFVKKGNGSYTIDEQSFPFSDHTLYFTNPGHIKSFDIHHIDDAWIITLTEHFLRENVHLDIFAEFPFLLAETVPPRKLPEADFAVMENLYKQIAAELSGGGSYTHRIVGNLFVVLLLKIKESFWADYNPIEEGDRNSQIVASFKQELEQSFLHLDQAESPQPMLQVQDIAQQLQLHPNYLNSVIKSKTGKTVHEWISGRTLSAAKSLLKNTSLSAKEISYRLGFSEPTHFSRFFKKQTSQSPGQYRKSAL